MARAGSGQARGRPSPAGARAGLVAAIAAAAFAAAIVAAGCSLDYGTELAEEIGDGTPDAVVLGFEHTVVENGSPRFRISADRGESYRALEKMKLSGVKFVEYSPDGDGEVVSEGSADSAVLYTDTESAEMSGSVRLRSARDGVTVSSAYLKWDGEAKTLESRADAVTTLADDDGSSLSGSGFRVDARTRSFGFGRRVDGAYSGGDEAE